MVTISDRVDHAEDVIALWCPFQSILQQYNDSNVQKAIKTSAINMMRLVKIILGPT